MITEFKLESVATYKNTVVVSDLKKLNFFYGANGCGKTTISRLLADPNAIIFAKSSVTNESGYKTYVYNQDFIDKNYHSNDHLSGIFTLGDDSKEAEIQIIKIKKEIEEISKNIAERNKYIDEKSDKCLVTKQRLEKNNLVIKAWDFKRRIEEKSELIRTLLTGFNNSKEAFFNELERRSQHNTFDEVTFDEIVHKASILYGEKQSFKNEIVKVSLDGFVQFRPIVELSQVIINSTENNQISELIAKVNHLSWFEKGIDHLKANENSCPFCNKQIDDDLGELINKSIDQSYKEKKLKVQNYYESYEESGNELIQMLTSKISALSNEIDVSNLLKNLEIIDLKIKENLKIIKEKLVNLNQVVSLEKFSDSILEINIEIEKYNDLVKKQNQLILNRKEEEITLRNQLWSYVLIELNEDIKSYEKNNEKFNKEIEEIKANIKVNSDTIRKLDLAKAEWATKASVTEATCIAINKLLNDFGFSGFSLDLIDDSGHYQIIREDGSDAKSTLSEGEKTFITFLYFYHLILGGETTHNISINKIIVIDDPISSLDSEIIFIVSTLLKSLYREILDESSTIRQIFILTHNIYFNSEVTSYKGGRGFDKKNVCYCLVKKINGNSKIDIYEKNPIINSYEYLWDEYRNSEINSVIGVQNIMRRILENYFKYWGNNGLNQIVDKFEGHEKIVVSSLIDWMHSGSHNIFDDYNLSTQTTDIGQYKSVFRKVFEHTKQIGHYNMMMKIEDEQVV